MLWQFQAQEARILLLENIFATKLQNFDYVDESTWKTSLNSNKSIQTLSTNNILSDQVTRADSLTWVVIATNLTNGTKITEGGMHEYHIAPPTAKINQKPKK